jgi:hypothetical protein
MEQSDLRKGPTRNPVLAYPDVLFLNKVYEKPDEEHRYHFVIPESTEVDNAGSHWFRRKTISEICYCSSGLWALKSIMTVVISAQIGKRIQYYGISLRQVLYSR